MATISSGIAMDANFMNLKEISLNMTNVRLLKIESYIGSVTSGSHTHIYLADAFLLRTLTDAAF